MMFLISDLYGHIYQLLSSSLLVCKRMWVQSPLRANILSDIYAVKLKVYATMSKGRMGKHKCGQHALNTYKI